MDIMEIASPTEYVLPTSAALATQASVETGSCATDRMTISNPGGSAVPVICGYNTGQHVYIDASDSCNSINLDMDTGSSQNRKWQFRVTQYECSSRNAPVRNCLQWFTGISGEFASFNFDTSATTVSLTAVHLQDQYYDICWRRERGYCSLCFSVKISAAADAASSFGISASGAPAAFQSAADSLCSFAPTTAIVGGVAITTNGLGPAHTDFISVVNLQPSIGTTNTAGATRVCGRIFEARSAQAATATACTWSAPFKWGVHFDGGEIIAQIGAAAATGTTMENVQPAELIAGQGQGYTGFYMSYWQNKC